MDAPYGTWSSPIDGRAVAADRGWTYSLVTATGDNVYWSEARPLEGGRDALVRRRADGTTADAIPAGFSARTRVHEYGGGAYTVDGETRSSSATTPTSASTASTATASRGRSRRSRRRRSGSVTPTCGSRATGSSACASGRPSPEHVNELVALPADGSAEPHVIAHGHDFYSAPRVSPDGRRIAWLTWDHPRMPWEGSELWVADFVDGELRDERLVAGGPEEAIVQPEWSPDGVLHFSSDRTGWWNLYRGEYEPVTAVEAEIGGPLWVFGESWYAFLPDGRIVCVISSDGSDRLAVVERDGALRYVDLELTRIVDLTTDGERALFVGASPTRSPSIVAADVTTGAIEVLSDDGEEVVDAAFVSVPRPLRYPTTGGKTAHALFYPPHHPEHSGPAGERPPLLVRIHGGPTAHVTATLSPEIQFFTSRGFAVVDVNYGGSTGYGREYRDRLRGEWGVVDTDDAVNAARALAEAGEVDGERMAITGGSAGGWTVLCALAFAPGVFAAGRRLLRRLRPVRLRRGHAQVRVALRRLARRPVARLRGAETTALPDQPRRQDPRPGDHPPGPRGQGRPAAAVRARRRCARGQRHPVRVPRLRGRAARVPQGRDAAARGRGRALVLRPGLRLRARRPDRAGRDHQGDGR